MTAGGAAKSSFYMQMKADVIGRTIRILESGEAGIMGMGMVCAVALGDYADYAEAASHFVRIKGEFNPRTDYTRQYESYMKVQRHIRALYRDFR